jgi:hypothetical protein
VIRREHGAERRDDAVEALVLERQLLSVAFDPLDFDTGFGRATPRVLEELGRDVQANDLRAAARSRNRDVTSRAGADVQQIEAGAQVDAVEDNRAD